MYRVVWIAHNLFVIWGIPLTCVQIENDDDLSIHIYIY